MDIKARGNQGSGKNTGSAVWSGNERVLKGNPLLSGDPGSCYSDHTLLNAKLGQMI